MKVFFDANVLVYLFDGDAPEKRERAAELLANHAERDEIVVSTQVLQEFYVTVTRKLARPLALDDAETAVRRFSEFTCIGTDGPLVRAGIRTSIEHRLTLWDAMVVEAAKRADATVLLTEELTDGRRFGDVLLRNPFA